MRSADDQAPTLRDVALSCVMLLAVLVFDALVITIFLFMVRLFQ